MNLGQHLRDQGITLVTANSPDFHAMAEQAFLRYFGVGDTVTADDMRGIVERQTRAPSPNSWGAFITRLSRKGYLKATGECRQSRRPSARARSCRTG